MLTIDAAFAIEQLNALTLRAANTRPVLALIASHAASGIVRRMVDSKEMDGSPWAAWKESTEHYRQHKGNVGQGLLWDEGTLLHSIRVAIENREVAIGTSVPYAAFLQDGTERMKARPFIGWEDDDTAFAERTMVAYLEGV